MGFSRTKDGQEHRTYRAVEKYPEDLEIFKAKLKVLGGIWKIHRTVNARDVQKARNLLLHYLIDFPEKASYVDSLWRTCLLQKECIFGEKKFMFDVDTSDAVEQEKILDNILCSNGEVLERVFTPSGGCHIVTKPFDSREVCELPNVTLLRDGYIYVCTVKGE